VIVAIGGGGIAAGAVRAHRGGVVEEQRHDAIGIGGRRTRVADGAPPEGALQGFRGDGRARSGLAAYVWLPGQRRK
jgi:hypothetical protein